MTKLVTRSVSIKPGCTSAGKVRGFRCKTARSSSVRLTFGLRSMPKTTRLRLTPSRISRPGNRRRISLFALSALVGQRDQRTYCWYISAPLGCASICSRKRQSFSLSSVKLLRLPTPAVAFPFFSPSASSSSSSPTFRIGLLLRSSARRWESERGSRDNW